MGAMEESLERPPGPAFEVEMVRDLPEPARRLLTRCIPEGAPLFRSLHLEQRAWMKMDAQKPHVKLRCREILAPTVGFLWRARAWMGPVPVSVRDHYLDGCGAVRVTIAGLVPVAHDRDGDVARSSRGRLVAESIWCPTALVGCERVAWHPVDDEHVRCAQTVDGETVETTLRVDPTGRLREVRMERHGNEGRDDWGPTPYGFEVRAEDTFDGIAIPTRLRGGWWFGTDRYDPEAASRFEIARVRFRG